MHPDPGLLFDAEWYLAQNPDVMAAGQNPLEHYLFHGGQEGRSPHPLFDARWYRTQNPDVAAHEAPLTHYLTRGGMEGRDPHPLFDTGWYVSQNPGAAAQNPLLHYLANANTSDPHPLFDTGWYLAQNPDVAEKRVNPLVHFLSTGAFEKRDPHPLFDVNFYLSQNPDVAAGGDNPLLHYLAAGAREGREPSAQFHAGWYLSAYPDIAHTNPLLHYIQHGRAEGRLPAPRRQSFPSHASSKMVLAHRGDGFGTRLLTILHARMLAEAAGFALRVAWPEQGLPFYENENLLRDAGQGLFQGDFVFEGEGHLRGDFLDIDAINQRRVLKLSEADRQMRDLYAAPFRKAVEDFDVLVYESPFLLVHCVKQNVHVPHEIRRLWRSVAWHPAIAECAAAICNNYRIQDCIAVHVRRGDIVNMLTRADPAYLTPERMTQVFHRYAPLHAFFDRIDAVRGSEKSWFAVTIPASTRCSWSGMALVPSFRRTLRKG